MELSPLKILLVSSDKEMAQRVNDLLLCAAKEVAVTVAPTADAGLALVATNNFHAILFEIGQANAAALFQITSLTTKAPQQAVIVIGPTEDESFLAEAVFSGAQDYLGRDQLQAQTLRHALHCSIARQQERIALVAEKENYYGLFDHLVEGIFRTTPSGNYLLANVALARIYGYDSPVQLMAGIKDIANRLYVDHGRREEFVRLMQENDTLSGFESKIYRKDETIIWIEENCRAVRDAQGKLLYYEGTVEDITAQRQMAEALKRSESLYHSLVETMPQGVFRRDRQGRFTFANQTYCKFFGLTPDQIIGRTDFDNFPKELAEKYWHDDLEIMEKGETREIIETAQPKGRAGKGISPRYQDPAARRRRQRHRSAGNGLGHHREDSHRGKDSPHHRRARPQPRGAARQECRHGGKPPHRARNPAHHAAADVSRFSRERHRRDERLPIRPPLRTGGIRQRRFF